MLRLMTPRRAGERSGWNTVCRQRHARWALLQVSAQLLAMVVVFLLTPVQLHRMGSERYGIIVLATSIGGYLMFLELGVGWALTRFLAASMQTDKEQAKRYIGAAFAITVPIGLAAGVLLTALAGTLARTAFSVSQSTRAETVFAFRALAAFLPLALAFNVVSAVARALERFFLLAVVGGLVPVGINLTWVVVAGKPHDIAFVALAQIGVIGLATIGIGAALVRSRGDAIRLGRPTAAELTALLRFGGWSTVSRMGFLGLTTLDTVLVGIVLSPSVVPSYAIAFTIASRIVLFCSTAVAVLMPTLSRRHASDPASASSAAVRADPLITGLTVATAATLALSGEPFLASYVDSSFAGGGAGVGLAFLAVAFGAYGISSLDGVLLEAAGQPSRPAVAMVTGAVIGLPALVLFAEIFGVGGAAGGAACGALTTAILQMRSGCRLRGESYGVRAVRLARAAAPPLAGAVFGSGLARVVDLNGYLFLAVTGTFSVAALVPTARRGLNRLASAGTRSG